MCLFGCNGVKISHRLVDKGGVVKVQLNAVLGVLGSRFCGLTAPAESCVCVRSVTLAFINRSYVFDVVQFDRHGTADTMHTDVYIQCVLVAV